MNQQTPKCCETQLRPTVYRMNIRVMATLTLELRKISRVNRCTDLLA
uniref:Uncharacterized protein n=1 Tax=Arundo donax TaxID=35708 RepID=A0A0A9H1V8_ARUDO